MRSGLLTNLPNLISLSRLLFSPLILLLSEKFLLFAFTLLALSDALDGFLARRLKAQTELGKVLDPLADKVMILFGLLVCVYKAERLPEWLFYMSLSRDVFLLIGASVLTVKIGKVPKSRPLGKAYTFFFSGLIVLCLYNFPVPWLHWFAVLLLFASWFDYTVTGFRILKSQTFSLS
ncbi:MAG: CDP-alcohol phosphatidyltransferase family protein [Aquificaceae bacterium]|nr:CDP-alcohol phosphatidyltransferase family protein [Aquificaceae bacterium]